VSTALVIGGGFAGVEAAIFLRKHGVETTLLSNRDHTWIYPITIWIPTSGIKPDKVKLPLDKLDRRHGFTFRKGNVKALHLDEKRVKLDDGEIAYDYLVIAAGQDKLRPKGVEHTLSICGKPADTFEIQRRLEQLAADGKGRIAFGFGGNPKDPSSVRGGPVFELLFNVDGWLRKKGLRDKFELDFFAPMPEPGKKMGPKALGLMDGYYKRIGVNVHGGTKISGFESDGISFVDGAKITSDLTIFVPAGTGLSFIAEAGLPLNAAGFVRVDPSCRVEGRADVWAVGDVAALEGPDWRAKQGHVAELMGRFAAADIALAISSGGTARNDADYREHLEIICLMDTGNGAALIKRNSKRSRLIVLPIIGHWMKRAWGLYWKWSKMKYIPRIPGM